MPHSQPPITSLFIGGASLIGLVVSFVLLNQGSGGLGIGVLALSGVTALASVITYIWQDRGARRDNSALLQQYAAKLDELTVSEDRHQPGLAELAWDEEGRARRANDPPLLAPDRSDQERQTLLSLILNNSARLWQRSPDDPDFLHVRFGIGRAKPHFEVRLDNASSSADMLLPVKHPGFRHQHERAEDAVKHYAWLEQVPITVSLRDHAALAIVTGPAAIGGEGLARALIGQVSLNHSPREARVVIVASTRRLSEWEWARPLAAGDANLPALIGDSSDREQGIQRLHAELIRREQLLGDRSYERSSAPPLPHLVIVVDALTPNERNPLNLPAIELALRRGKELGTTVVSLHTALNQAPAQVTIVADLADTTLLSLWPDPPPPLKCRFDDLPLDECQRLLHAFTRYQPAQPAEQGLPAEVRLLDLFTPRIPDPRTYSINDMWQMGRSRLAATRQEEKRSLAIPIGRGASGQAISLDFTQDGPHGLLIGRSGSGKSELLRSIITAIAVIYPPDRAQLVLVDYKGGIELEAFKGLPHTLAVLTNLARPGQTTRFLTMLESELNERQERRKRGEDLPYLFVVIDEFAEMVAPHSGPNDNSDAVVEHILRILRLGRALNVHLLFATQRLEGQAIGKLRGYVQYSICLRTDSEQDSKEVLGRPDAAHLPSDAPGRGYILRGNHELQIFQAGRVAAPNGKTDLSRGEQPRASDEIIVERMKSLAGDDTTARWPDPLPMPDRTAPTPLVLLMRGGFTPVEDAWNAYDRLPLPKMVIPLGLFDRPAELRRDWFLADLYGHEGPLHGGPLLVMGDINAGKTTTLKTLLLYLAMYASPDDVRWYVLDQSGAFGGFASLPHARDWLDPDAVNIVSGFDTDAFSGLKGRIEQALLADQQTRPSLLLVVDDYDELAQRHPTELLELARTLAQGRDKSAYLAISAARMSFNALPETLVNMMVTKILLYMNHQSLGSLIGTRPPFALDPVPGHGFVQTRTSLDEIQIAAPVYGKTDAERTKNLDAIIERITPPKS